MSDISRIESFMNMMKSKGPSILKSQVVYSKQPKLGLTQEFVVDCAHALWVVHSIKTSIINVAEMVFI